MKMVKVEFLGPIDQQSIDLDVKDLKELSKELKKDDKINHWLDKCAVAINDEIIGDINTPLQDGDKVSLLPPVCGG